MGVLLTQFHQYGFGDLISLHVFLIHCSLDKFYTNQNEFLTQFHTNSYISTIYASIHSCIHIFISFTYSCHVFIYSYTSYIFIIYASIHSCIHIFISFTYSCHVFIYSYTSYILSYMHLFIHVFIYSYHLRIPVMSLSIHVSHVFLSCIHLFLCVFTIYSTIHLRIYYSFTYSLFIVLFM